MSGRAARASRKRKAARLAEIRAVVREALADLRKARDEGYANWVTIDMDGGRWQLVRAPEGRWQLVWAPELPTVWWTQTDPHRTALPAVPEGENGSSE
jgi:hypothetical protein